MAQPVFSGFPVPNHFLSSPRLNGRDSIFWIDGNKFRDNEGRPMAAFSIGMIVAIALNGSIGVSNARLNR